MRKRIPPDLGWVAEQWGVSFEELLKFLQAAQERAKAEAFEGQCGDIRQHRPDINSIHAPDINSMSLPDSCVRETAYLSLDSNFPSNLTTEDQFSAPRQHGYYGLLDKQMSQQGTMPSPCRPALVTLVPEPTHFDIVRKSLDPDFDLSQL